jgi:Glycosyl hydrolases family 35
VAAIRAEHGLLRVGARRIPLLAGEVQFWRLDPSAWETTLRAVASEGIPIVSTYLSWRRHVAGPEAPFTWRGDGRLDLRRFLALCAAHGLLVHLKPGPWICAEETNGGYPDWLLADHELLALDAQDRPIVGYNPPFQHLVPCYLHRRYLAHARRWIHLVHEHVHDFIHPRGPVALIQLDNEPSYCFRDGMYEADYHPVALAAFARWTLRRHGSLEGVKRAWRLELLTKASIDPPREPVVGVEPGSGRWHREHDWICFREWLLGEHLRRLRHAHEDAGAKQTAFTVNYNTHAIDGVPQSPHAIRSATDAIAGVDHYYEPPLTRNDLLVLARTTALARARDEPLPWSPEIQSGIWRAPGEHVAYPDPVPAEQELYYLAALAFGLKGLNFYMLVNRENWQFAPLEPGGLPTPMLDAVRKVIQLIARLPVFGSLEPISPVALAWQTSYARDAYGAPANDAGRNLPYQMTVGAFAELAYAGYLPRIWNTQEAPPADAAAIVTPAGSYMERDLQEQLARSGKQGLPVVLVGGPPRHDENGQPCDILAAAVEAGDVVSLSRVKDVSQTLYARSIEPPVYGDRDDGFAILHQSSSQQLLFVLNVHARRSTFMLRFANSGITALKPELSDGAIIPVLDRTARVELEPHTGLVFQALTS